MNIFNGLKELVTSPSGIFSLICLSVLTFLTIKFPSAMGGAPWVAFFGIIPAALGYFEHAETMLAAQQNPPSPFLPAPPVFVVPVTSSAATVPSVDTTTTVTATIPLANLPARGQL
jgi:hypothetical protein